MSQLLYRRTLVRSVDILGDATLASLLGVEPSQIDRWCKGVDLIPVVVFDVLIDCVLKDDIEHLVRDPKGRQPEDHSKNRRTR